jgi:predicted nucleotidyltransferase
MSEIQAQAARRDRPHSTSRQSAAARTRAPDRLGLAREIAEHLGRQAGVLAVAVFGSVARGSAGQDSDTDLLVLVAEPGPSRRELVARLPKRFDAGRLGAQVYTDEDLAELLRYATSFTSHLRREAQVLVDPTGRMTELLAAEPGATVAVKDELQGEISQLNAYGNLDVFRGNYLFVLGRLYRLAKAVVMLGLYADGEPTFDRHDAFAEFRRRHPETAASVTKLERLQPFYLFVMRRVRQPFPFPYRGSRREVLESIQAIRDLAAAV